MITVESHRHCNKVQDAYTLRCVPQVHGIVHETIDFVRQIISIEMNSATDNPLVFAEQNEIISGGKFYLLLLYLYIYNISGNFHGEYPAKVN